MEHLEKIITLGIFWCEGTSICTDVSSVKKVQVHFESEGFYIWQVTKVKKHKTFSAECTDNQLYVIPARHHVTQQTSVEECGEECH